MPRILKLLLTSFSFLLLGHTYAQYYTYGQDPASLKWRQIHTNNFRLIYPETWEGKAQDLAHFLEAIREPMNASLNSNPKPIPVILRNQTMLSNGFVMWAPKRIEMVTAIPSDNQAIDWMRYLTVHEYRHVVQVEATNTSTTGFLSRIFGQHITGSVVGLHLPLWFLEGDAVLAETSFTRSGRGRLPEFTMPLAAQLLEQGRHSYDKAIFGSYRDMVPNHYILGYHIVAATQSKYGFEPFQKATRQVGATPFLPGSFSRGIKSSTGKNLRQLYESAMSELEDEWESQLSQESIDDFQTITAGNIFDYVSYINPQYIDDDTFIAFRTTPADIPRLLKIKRDGSEEVIFTPGFGYFGTLSYASGKAAWAEIRRDPRWDYRVWTDVIVLDIESGKCRFITHRGRMQAPRLSPDGSKIAAIELDETNQWSLVILSSGSGEVLQRISDPDIDFLMEPAWSDDMQSIVAIAFKQNIGKSLVAASIGNPAFTTLFEAGFADIFSPFVKNGLVYFSGTWSGKDEIYALGLESKQLYTVVTSGFGATAPGLSNDGSRMLFSNLTSFGSQIGEQQILLKDPVDLKSVNNLTIPLYAQAEKMQNLLLDTLSLSGSGFESKRFRKFPNLFHFHSWIPAALDVDGISANPGVSVFSQDLLGTTVLGLGYEYIMDNNGHKAFADVSFKALYPVFDLRFEAGSEDRFYRSGDSIVKLRTSLGKITGGVGLPLSFNHNALIYGFSPRISTSQEIYSFNFLNEDYTRGLRSVSYRFSGYAYQRMAYRDLYPKWAISVAAGYTHTPFNSTERFRDVDAGNVRHGVVSTFVPGLLRHHSMRFYVGWQQKIYGQTYFGDAIRVSRGYHALPNDEIVLLSASYAMPMWYPDLALGSLLYAKRVKANIFYDYSRVTFRDDFTNLASYGLDILVDAHLLRMPMPLEFGLRTIYLENENNFRFEFLWGVDFYAVGHLLKSVNMPPKPYF